LVRATNRLNKATERYADITDKIKTLQEQVKTLQILNLVEPMLRLLMDKDAKTGEELRIPFAKRLSPILQKNGFSINAGESTGTEHSSRVLWEIFSDLFGEVLEKRKSDQNTEKKSE
jgi:hypothetical protein